MSNDFDSISHTVRQISPSSGGVSCTIDPPAVPASQLTFKVTTLPSKIRRQENPREFHKKLRRTPERCIMSSTARLILMRRWDSPPYVIQRFRPSLGALLALQCIGGPRTWDYREHRSYSSVNKPFCQRGPTSTWPPLPPKRWHAALRDVDDDPFHPKIKALLVDAAGTLIEPSEPSAEVRTPKLLVP